MTETSAPSRREKLTDANHDGRECARPAARVFVRAAGPDPVLLLNPIPMLWLIPITILVVGTGVIVRAARRRGSAEKPLTTEPVSGQWLAEIRGRDDQYW
jgi:hypothetical protein